ncbi:MAG: tetratricopeptide repeat protein [Candidatus Aminicenantes bacterium]|nr:tetratricopeptide repeat protein [Candidatus Aminicenantes bacterium]NIM79366.1 tetratricopeptide repeat protein [Candidatus Aminicenantes bacterium]NIN18643.1 tetratricopeptide repeat protein [Candidatus Aminicenantes bacterium]NIN42532.1 tetratricopeptide repeat protein [Candidatus Aminicenantes bacterium]NIN85298.1 tetratricopeptide repeat protein [Candidatus Aminicenantes bacterium]
MNVNINVSFLLIIFLVSITIFGVPVLLYGQQQGQGQDQDQDQGTPGEDKLVPVPNPQLDHLEKAVGIQLREGRRMVDAVTGNPAESREKRARVYGELGQLYHAYELNEAAEACYRNALVLDPSNVEWNYSLGYLLQSVGTYSEALQLFQKARAGRQDPDLDYLVYIRLGECHRSLNQPHQAKLAFQAAYQVNPLGPAVLARLGEIALEEKHYDEAIEYLASALKKQPDANKLHYSLAMAYRGKGDMEQARSHLAKHGKVGVQPPDPLKTRLENLVTGYRLHLLAGKLAFSAGRYNEAIESFQKAIDADSKEVGARINLAAALGKLKKYRQALAQLQAAVKLAPDNVTVHFNLGTVYGYFNNHKKAIEHLQVVVKKSPKDSQAHLALAGALRSDGQLDKALEHYNAALSIDPGLIWAWVDMSSLLSQTGKHSEALEVLEDAHSRIPHDGPIAHALARLLASSPVLDKRQGKRALELALKVYQALKSFEHARTVAMAYAELNQCDKAVEWMEKAIELAENSHQSGSVLEMLKRNLAYLKTNRPCRVPAQQEREINR